MPQFDEEQQNKKLDEIRRREEENLARVLSQKYDLQYLDLSDVSINTEALQLVGEEEAREALLAAFARVGKKVSVGVKSPNKTEAQDIVKRLEDRGYHVSLFMISSQSLERAWKHYKDISLAVETKAGILDISGTEIQQTLSDIKTLNDARERLDDVLGKKKAYKISSILEIIISGALSQHASDVHIEPEETYVRLRFRLDGVLIDVLRFDRETYELLLSRIKLLSGLKINIRDVAQDGRFSIRIDQKDIEMRTSVLPGAHGESIVLRILDPSSIALDLEELGVEGALRSAIEREIKKPNGMILNTGPTGSGKTTTLYAFLRKIQKPEIKIITIEDPVEYRLPGIVQTQTTEDYTFAQGLRSGLRQDPDIIMIGEIRDSEVAETAINAALTGHLVFSTLHTNNAAGAFPRLIDLGVNSSVISSAINLVLAQRLVRKLKPECRQEIQLTGENKERVSQVLDSIVDKSLIPQNTNTIWEPLESGGGCEIAYDGRLGIFEAIEMDDEIEKLVEMSSTSREIAEGARKQGMLTMEQDGILKVLRGTTSLSELDRVLSIEVQEEKGTPHESSLEKKEEI